MVAKVKTVALIGLDGALVEVETDLKQGLPGIQIVGMGNKAVDEARERVRSAISNSLLDFPSRKLTINLAPAELPKDGAHFDLPIAISILVASGQLRQHEIDGVAFTGELSLTGALRPIRGVISIVQAAKDLGLTSIYVPSANEGQAQLIKGIKVFSVQNLKEVFLHIKGELSLNPPTLPANPPLTRTFPDVTIDDVHGQTQAKRALEIAVAGRHNLLLSGPPGAGKTMLARALHSLLPPLSDSEALEVTKIHSLAGQIDDGVLCARPFRTPHHTTSLIALIGGGARPRPGEISLAHLGVLFLDEFPEYPRASLESLRQPLEDKRVSITRANSRVTYPADFMLVATMNPCPCGYLGDSMRECVCATSQIQAYQKRISGPLLDRIDMIVNVSKAQAKTILSNNTLHKTQQSKVLVSIDQALLQQRNRYNSRIIYNASIPSRDIKTLFKISTNAKDLLNNATSKLNLTTRGYFKVLRVARTIADLASEQSIESSHIAEALQFRAELPT